jgi:hypothetical protein
VEDGKIFSHCAPASSALNASVAVAHPAQTRIPRATARRITAG